MSIWQRKFTIIKLNQARIPNLTTLLGIQYLDYGDDYLSATMPVDERTVQPYGILHGGASVALAETLGSVASSLCIPEDQNKVPVGVEINANHLKSVSNGIVTGKAFPVRLGKKLHVWNIEIRNENLELVCVSRLTTMIIDKK